MAALRIPGQRYVLWGHIERTDARKWHCYLKANLDGDLATVFEVKRLVASEAEAREALNEMVREMTRKVADHGGVVIDVSTL
jgi:hypothetical protein